MIPSAGPNFEQTWFTRTPLKLSLGSGDQIWSITFFGTIEADYMSDSTRSYNENIGRDIVARSDTYEGTVGRTQFSMRNTRVGFLLDSPRLGVVSPSAVFQGDFAGNQPRHAVRDPRRARSDRRSPENAYYNSPTFRIRHAYLTLRNPYVDVLAGHTFDVFGFQNYYLALSLMGLPNQISTRTTQFRLSRSFGAGGPISVDVARRGGAARAARLAGAGLHGRRPLLPPRLEGDHDAGQRGDDRRAAVAVGVGHHPPVQGQRVHAAAGAELEPHRSAGACRRICSRPIIPAANANDRGNRLSLVGSFVIGTGIADLISAGGNARFPTLPNSMQENPPPEYTADIDNGLVTFDTTGVLHTIDWCAAKGGVPVLLPRHRALHPGGQLHLRALAQPRQAVSAGRRRDRASGRRRQHLAVG